MSAADTLRQCRATLSLIDRADCKDDAVWQKVVDTQAEVDRVLRDGEKPISVPQPVYQVQSPEAPDSSLWHDVDVRAFQRANKNGFYVRIMYAAAPAPSLQVVVGTRIIDAAKRLMIAVDNLEVTGGAGGYPELLLRRDELEIDLNSPQPAAAPSGDVERDAALKFADHIINGIFEGGHWDGGDVQELAVKHGLLKPQTMQGPCNLDGACQCAQNSAEFPSTCYRKTYVAAITATKE